MLTYYATFREVCATEKDVMFLSNVKSIFDVVYFSLGFALIPIFIGMKLNIRIIALIFLPLTLTMLIPFFMLKENENSESDNEETGHVTLKEAFKCSFSNKTFIYWMFTISIVTIGLQLFLGGINEVFSSTGLNMTVVMASSFAPVPIVLLNAHSTRWFDADYRLQVGPCVSMKVFPLLHGMDHWRRSRHQIQDFGS